jgi:hypothetical protein
VVVIVPYSSCVTRHNHWVVVCTHVLPMGKLCEGDSPPLSSPSGLQLSFPGARRVATSLWLCSQEVVVEIHYVDISTKLQSQLHLNNLNQ